jgi:hypothetical protein
MQSFQALPPEQTPAHTPSPLSPPPQSFLNKIKAHKPLVILLTVGIIFLSGITGYFVISPSEETLLAPATEDRSDTIPTSDPNSPSPTIAPNPTSPPTTPAPTLSSTAWKTYANANYGYSIKYPSDWTATNLGALEPLVPSYIVFNPKTASSSARYITVAISTRSYSQQLALAASGSATTVGGIIGSRQAFQDSDGNTSTVVTLPRTNNLLVIRGKTTYLPIFNQMLTTLQTTK